MPLTLKSKNGSPLKGGDIIRDFHGRDWTFLYITNGPVSHGKIVVQKVLSNSSQFAPPIVEFFPSVFPDVFVVEKK